jgi:hypothetical protein
MNKIQFKLWAAAIIVAVSLMTSCRGSGNTETENASESPVTEGPSADYRNEEGSTADEPTTNNGNSSAEGSGSDNTDSRNGRE